MQKKSNTKLVPVIVVGIVLACLAACILYAACTKSFPIPAVENVLFKNISFDYNEGEDAAGHSSKTERLWFWETPQAPADVNRPGYDLIGWNTNTDGLTLQAKWKLTEYPILYDLNFGELHDVKVPVSYTIESEPYTLPTPSRYAYNFAGWTLDDGTQVEQLDFAKLRGEITVKANWEQLNFIKPETLYLGDDLAAAPYVYCINSDTAPKDTAGVWQGVANVQDGRPTYYLGHNPGIFTPVKSFTEGSRFAVCDDSGNLGVYEVEKIIPISYEGTMWTRELEVIAMPSGEYASLQTCRGDKQFMDIYVGKRIDG